MPAVQSSGGPQDNNVYKNPNQDDDYLKLSEAERELCREYGSLDLPKEQKELIDQWISTIHTEDAADSMVVFRMAMQCCFLLLLHPAALM